MTGVSPIELPAVGQTARLVKTITSADVQAFADVTGDRNPLHVDQDFASRTLFQRPVVHGMLLAGYVSTLVGMHIPGAGALWTQQRFQWKIPVYAGDTITLTLRVNQVSRAARSVAIEVNAVNQHGRLVMEGEGVVTAVDVQPEEAVAASAGCDAPVALVTGASGAIGGAVARALAHRGMKVGLQYWTHAEAADTVQRQVEELGAQSIAAACDLRDMADVSHLAESMQARFGHAVDVLVHCASLPAMPKPFLESDWDDTQRMIDVLVKGAWNCARAVLPAMCERRSGVIVLMGSALGAAPVQWSGYLVAKAALRSLAKSLAAEFGPSGVRVNLVSPGIVNTATVAAVPERLRKVQVMQTPLRRTIRIEDVAEVTAFLCSEAASALTGVEIPVCAGAVMT